MRAMKDSGIPWIGEIPDGWKVMPHKRVMRKVKEIQEHYNGENILSLTMRGVIVRDLDAGGKMPTTFDGYQKVYPNNLLQCLFDIDVTPRCVGLIKNEGLTSPAYSQFAMYSNGYAPYYDYLLRYMDDGKTLLHLSKNLRSSLTETDFGAIDTCVPPLAEQQKIASFLDRKCSEIDEMIALQEQIIEELKAYKQSVITEAVTKGLNPAAPMRDSGIEWIGSIPEHWEVKRLKFIAERHNQKVSDEVLPYIGLENVESFSERFIETENEYDITQAQVCAVGDVIFGKLRPYLGKAMVIKKEHCCSSEFLVLSGSGAPSYLRYLMLSDWFVEIVNASTYGTKMPRANADYIMNMQVVCPSIEERKAIADYLDEKCADIDSLIQTKLSKIDSLKEYKKSIIYEYVTGKREVNE